MHARKTTGKQCFSGNAFLATLLYDWPLGCAGWGSVCKFLYRQKVTKRQIRALFLSLFSVFCVLIKDRLTCFSSVQSYCSVCMRVCTCSTRERQVCVCVCMGGNLFNSMQCLKFSFGRLQTLTSNAQVTRPPFISASPTPPITPLLSFSLFLSLSVIWWD